MATITFKAKAVEFKNCDGTGQHLRVQVPTLTRKHCDIEAFRRHPRYGAWANSDLFPGMLKKIRDQVVAGHGDWIRLDNPPPGVGVDTSGFLAKITIEV